MSGWGWFFLILLLILLAYGGFVGWRIFQARRSGEPIPSWKAFVPFMKTGSSTNYPTPRSAGPIEWIKDKIDGLRNKRTRGGGGYEESRGLDAESGGYSGVGSGRRGRGLEDDAWDSRVGNEDPYGHGPGGYYEEQELGLATPTPGHQNQPYSGADYMAQSTEYGGNSAARGRSQQREGDGTLDPFGDQHEAPSLRSVSPRPHETENLGASSHTRGQPSLDSTGSGDGNTSPISTRKSAFREGI